MSTRTASPVRRRPIGSHCVKAVSRSGRAHIVIQQLRHSGIGWGVFVFTNGEARRTVVATEAEARSLANQAWRDN